MRPLGYPVRGSVASLCRPRRDLDRVLTSRMEDRVVRGLAVVAIAFLVGAASLIASPGSQLASGQTLPCQSSVGPGIPPPAGLPQGLPGFHAAWYGQSGYMTLCPGARATATVAYFNTGSFGWVAGRLGQTAYLGTWEPAPGQDRPSFLGGDGTNGSPNTGWPRYNRIAVQPASFVGPGQVAWFQFSVQAPTTPGTYRLYLRPLIEGAQWMEDYGVFWVVSVRSVAAATLPTPTPVPQPAPVAPPTSVPPPAPGLTIWDIDGRATLLAFDDSYLGKVSSNQFDSESICNDFGCGFRSNPITHFAPFRSPVSDESNHPFRSFRNPLMEPPVTTA